jgi:inner membrane protein YidH
MPEPGVEDATRRTRLASERTYLAWWRTGVGAIAVGVGIGRLLPEHASGARWSYELVGVGFAVLGIAILLFGLRRTSAVEQALEQGGYAPINPQLLAALTAAGAVLGLAVIVLVLFG